ncbi:hypothetical protein HK102_009682, partial [Quaeritorhiza haematococci]
DASTPRPPAVTHKYILQASVEQIDIGKLFIFASPNAGSILGSVSSGSATGSGASGGASSGEQSLPRPASRNLKGGGTLSSAKKKKSLSSSTVLNGTAEEKGAGEKGGSGGGGSSTSGLKPGGSSSDKNGGANGGAAGGANGGEDKSGWFDGNPPSWKLRIITTDTASLLVTKDTEKEDRYRAIKDSWEQARPGRAAKAREARDGYLKLVEQGLVGPITISVPVANVIPIGAAPASTLAVLAPGLVAPAAGPAASQTANSINSMSAAAENPSVGPDTDVSAGAIPANSSNVVTPVSTGIVSVENGSIRPGDSPASGLMGRSPSMVKDAAFAPASSDTGTTPTTTNTPPVVVLGVKEAALKPWAILGRRGILESINASPTPLITATSASTRSGSGTKPSSAKNLGTSSLSSSSWSLRSHPNIHAAVEGDEQQLAASNEVGTSPAGTQQHDHAQKVPIVEGPEVALLMNKDSKRATSSEDLAAVLPRSSTTALPPAPSAAPNTAAIPTVLVPIIPRVLSKDEAATREAHRAQRQQEHEVFRGDVLQKRQSDRETRGTIRQRQSAVLELKQKKVDPYREADLGRREAYRKQKEAERRMLQLQQLQHQQQQIINADANGRELFVPDGMGGFINGFAAGLSGGGNVGLSTSFGAAGGLLADDPSGLSKKRVAAKK